MEPSSLLSIKSASQPKRIVLISQSLVILLGNHHFVSVLKSLVSFPLQKTLREKKVCSLVQCLGVARTQACANTR